MLQLCDTHISDTTNFPNGTGPKIEDSTFFDIITEMAPKRYNDTMWMCKWRNGVNLCDDFKTIMTDEGKS